MSTFSYLLSKVLEAEANGIENMSVGEGLACALALNRIDWVRNLGYTLAQALERIDEEWITLIPRVAMEIEKLPTHKKQPSLRPNQSLSRTHSVIVFLVYFLRK